MATIAATEDARARPISFVSQLREFLWLSSGMFSASALSLAFLGYFALGAAANAPTYFLAAVVSAILFGVATFLKLGPDEA